MAGGEDHVPDDAKDSDTDGEGAEEILEESPCRRWSKRREQVKQRDVPGIDAAYLAMDNETGNEVVWNEVQFSERKNFRAQEEKINSVFDHLTSLYHTNLVKFHKYWTDQKSEKPRIIFITEYMSSGSMSLFLQRTRKSGTPLSIKAWKKWCTQILSALNYLHSSSPPITHGNLTCNTVFIQQNGLIKIGCAPDAINHHVKTCRENMRNMHYVAPEYENSYSVTPAADIYSFGMCSLEIAVVGGLCGSPNGSNEGPVTNEVIDRALRSIEDPNQRVFLEKCLQRNPEERPNARELLFHPALFEVPSVKVLAAHAIVDSKMYDDVSDSVFRVPDNEKVAATSKLREMAYCQVPAFQVDLEKFLEDVRNGIYPLTAFGLGREPIKKNTGQSSSDSMKPPTITRVEALEKSQSSSSTQKRPDPEPTPSPPGIIEEESHRENRTILNIKITSETSFLRELTITLQLEDMMNRQLTTEVLEGDTAESLTRSLIHHGFICEVKLKSETRFRVEEEDNDDYVRRDNGRASLFGKI